MKKQRMIGLSLIVTTLSILFFAPVWAIEQHDTEIIKLTITDPNAHIDLVDICVFGLGGHAVTQSDGFYCVIEHPNGKFNHESFFQVILEKYLLERR